ncbi:hypothetical protein SBF1_8000005 [Candidatus Desulfosporosinus infrequens]|uniref:Uncharacterized protein n=1 Tax=Candidatus Desulfosporosinus infrequens TaxID=2043169 RepID=A0A2U3LTG7_9FIRM|nr:hypothetical protein SBF1_8000005 [Candidatus Desulfosporosinus infrequens]
MLKIRVKVMFHSHISTPLSTISDTIHISNNESAVPIKGTKLIGLGPPKGILFII